MKLIITLLFTFIYGLQSFGQNTKAYIAKIKDEVNVCNLYEAGIPVNTQIGNIITLRLTVNQLSKLENLNYFQELHEARKVKPDLIRALQDLRADSVHQGFNLETGYSGKDVIIGITDWGFDYTHPMFYDTALQKTRILAAWDQFKTSGPPPSGYNFGSEYEGEQELLQAEKDTYNIYEFATHGSHVAGIAGGGGAGIGLKGVAYDANFLMTTFLADEAAVIDGIAWMKKKAEEYKKRLVINMSWGLYNLGTLDGTSLLSQVLDSFSKQGVIFVTSGGNNGDVDLHIKKNFNGDTLQTRIEFYPFNAHPKMWGQSISMWGQKNKPFAFQLQILNSSKQVIYASRAFNTNNYSGYLDTAIIFGTDTITFNLSGSNSHPDNQNPHFRLRVQNKNNNNTVGLKTWANLGTVHYYNVVELTNDVGNWGMPFSALKPGWIAGDNEYGVGEPASTQSVITVAAHISEVRLSNGIIGGGTLANFSSMGPTIDERAKPDISAPGLQIESSISSFTTNNYTLTRTANFNGKNYPFAKFSGTSMSSPATAGVVALMLQANPSLSAVQAKQILIETARTDIKTGPIGDTASTSWGWGKVNALAAVQLAEKMRPIIPVDTISPSFEFFPNPAKDKLFFQGDWNTVYNSTLYDLNGKVILKGKIGSNTFLPVGDIQDGLYLIKIDGREKVYKVVLN